MQAILPPEVKLWLYLSATCETQSNQRWLWRACPAWQLWWPCSSAGMGEEGMATTPLLTLSTAPGWWKGVEESNASTDEEMSYFTGKSEEKRHWKVEPRCYSWTWHGRSWMIIPSECWSLYFLSWLNFTIIILAPTLSAQKTALSSFCKFSDLLYVLVL